MLEGRREESHPAAASSDDLTERQQCQDPTKKHFKCSILILTRKDKSEMLLFSLCLPLITS